eukprot:1010716-Pleurochrysis_carterae.AAC.1
MPDAARKSTTLGIAAATAAAKPAKAAGRAPKHAAAPTAATNSLSHLPVSTRLRSAVKETGEPKAAEELLFAG